MSYTPNALWTPSEKVDLLVNVLQSAFPDLPLFLLQIIIDRQIHPKWNEMALPRGRSVLQCQMVFEEMSRPFRPQGRPMPPQMPMTFAHNPNIAPAAPIQRQYGDLESFHGQPRQLQPRLPRSTDSPVPAVSNGEAPVLPRNHATEVPPEMRKKRGRPSKEEAEERDRALAAEGKVYQPKKRATKKFRASTGTPGPEAGGGGEASTSILQTPSRGTEVKEEGSSGKRRSRRQQQDESGATEDNPRSGVTEPEEPPSRGVQSPSDRLLASHREPSQHTAQQSTMSQAHGSRPGSSTNV